MNTAGVGGASTATESTLGEEIGALLGDFSDSDGSSSSDAAGDTPAERQDQPDSSAAPEGQPDAERAGDTPADAATAQPDPSTPVEPAEDGDLLAGAVPLPYVVNGEQRQFDGIMVLKDNAGAIVTPEALTLLTRRLGERDNLFEQNQTREKRYNDLEKLTEWRSKDGQGNPVVYSGAQGVEMRELSISLLKAEVQELRALFDRSPYDLVAQDEQGNVVWNKPAFESWNKQLDLVKRNAYHEGKSAFSTVAAQLNAPAPPATSFTADQMVELAPQAVDYIIQSFPDIKFSPDAKALLADIVQNPAYLRPATQADSQQFGVRVGQPFVDARITPVVQKIAAQQKAVATTVQSTVEADRRNAARLAAAAAGRRSTTPAKQPVAQPTQTDDRASRSDQLWNLTHAAIAGRG